MQVVLGYILVLCASVMRVLGEDEALTSQFLRLNPSDWGGGWVRADVKPETAQYFHPFSAWFDDRVSRFPVIRSGKTPELLGSYRDDLYIRILLTGQQEFLPSFFDNWDNNFLENMRKCTCKLHYEVPAGAASSLIAGGNLTLTVPVWAVVPSPLDFSWYPASFSQPYFAYCPLPKLIAPSAGGGGSNVALSILALNSPEALPTAVVLLPQNPNQEGNHFMPLQGRDDSLFFFESLKVAGDRASATTLSSSSDNKQAPVNSSSTAAAAAPQLLAVCIGPPSGVDFLSNDYDDVGAVIAMLTYYSALGVQRVYLSNPGLTRDHPTGESFHHWMHHLLYVLKKGSRAGKLKLTVDLVPDVARHKQKWHQTKHLDPEDSRHTAFVFPTLLQETCTHLALRDGVTHLLLADYNDYLVVHTRAQANTSTSTSTPLVASASLAKFLANLDTQHPTAAAYSFSAAVFLDSLIPGPSSDHAEAGFSASASSTMSGQGAHTHTHTLTSDADQDETMFSQCVDRNLPLADLLCKTRRTRVLEHGTASPNTSTVLTRTVTSYSRSRVIIRPSRVDAVSHDGATALPRTGWSVVNVPWEISGIFKYVEATWIKTAANFGKRDVNVDKDHANDNNGRETRWPPAADLEYSAVQPSTTPPPFPSSSHSQGTNLRACCGQGEVEDRSMLSLRDDLLTSPVYTFLAQAFTPLELSQYTSSRQHALHIHPNSTLTADFGHPPPAPQRAIAKNYRRLLIFSSLPPSFNSASNFRRAQLAIASWLHLVASAPPDKLGVRVLLLSEQPEACAALKLMALLPGCGSDGLPADPYNSSAYGGGGTDHHHLRKHVHWQRQQHAGSASGSAPGGQQSHGHVHGHGHSHRSEEAHHQLMCLPVMHCLHPSYGIPTIDCLFRTAAAAAIPGEYLMYTNSDMVFGEELLETLLALAEAPELQEQGFAAVGKRWNAPFTDEDICGNGQGGAAAAATSAAAASEGVLAEAWGRGARLQKLIPTKGGLQDTAYAIDYVVIHPSAVPKNLPPFMVGRASWDNIFVFWVLANSWRALVPPEVFNHANHSRVHIAGRGVVNPASVLMGPPLVSISDAVEALHLGIVGAEMYEFSKRRGSQWAVRLLTDWYRLQMGNIDSSNYFVKGKCKPQACKLERPDYKAMFAPTPSPTQLGTRKANHVSS